MTPDSAIATAADYADAMITARRSKYALVLLLLLMILAQIGLFFAARYTDLFFATAQAAPTTAPSVNWQDAAHYFCAACLFFGIVLSIILSFVLLLVVNIMLVGRLIGVARVTSAYIWSLLLILLLFPWQAFLDNVGLTLEHAPFKLPGVLWTWAELTDPVKGARFESAISPVAILEWARFVGLPLLAVVILLVIQVKSNRGMRQALGEDDVKQGEVDAPTQ